MKLSDEELRVKVAKAVGWKRKFDPCDTWWFLPDGSGNSTHRWNLPKYSTDLNACASLRAGLSEEERTDYVLALGEIATSECDMGWGKINATPRQHCLAFLKCKGVEL